MSVQRIFVPHQQRLFFTPRCHLVVSSGLLSNDPKDGSNLKLCVLASGLRLEERIMRGEGTAARVEAGDDFKLANEL